MTTPEVKRARLIDRPNRFLANVRLQDRTVQVFVPNPGRMYELMVPGKTVYLREAENRKRKTHYDMIAVEHEGVLISIDSNLPNRLLKRLLMEHRMRQYFDGYDRVVPEPQFYGGRFDFLLESERGNTVIEAKSCTLVVNGRACFPDAPTVRGARHMKHLARALDEERVKRAVVVFVVQRPDATVFSPNDMTDPLFGSDLRSAHRRGVEILPLVTTFYQWRPVIIGAIPYDLNYHSRNGECVNEWY